MSENSTVAPARATIEGFAFEYPTIDAALRHVSAR
jgi:NAD dependent epimerase/dehydratase family enzyme